MESKIAAILSYFTWVGFIIAFVAGDKNDEYLKHHINQALVLTIASTIVTVVGTVLSISLGSIQLLNALVNLMLTGINLAILAFAILGIISAAKEETKPLPIIGEIKIIK